MSDERTLPRARRVNVFDKVREKHGGNPEPEAPPLAPQGMPVQVVERVPGRMDLLKGAADRELNRFVALLGVLGTHLVTSSAIFPILIVALKIVSAVVLAGTGLSWIAAVQLALAIWVGGPLVFFLYRYYSGSF